MGFHRHGDYRVCDPCRQLGDGISCGRGNDQHIQQALGADRLYGRDVTEHLMACQIFQTFQQIVGGAEAGIREGSVLRCNGDHCFIELYQFLQLPNTC